MSEPERNPYAAPAQDHEPSSSSGSSDLQVWLESRLPPVCLKCGTTERVEHHRQTFKWSPRGARRNAMVWAAMFGVLGALFANSYGRDALRETIEVPLCGTCFVRRANGKYMVFGAAALVAVVFLLFFFRAMPPVVPPGGAGLIVLGALVVLMITSVIVKRWDVHAVHIDDYYIVLSGVATEAREKIDAYTPPKPLKPKKEKRKKRKGVS